jgi:predicted lipoprotein
MPADPNAKASFDNMTPQQIAQQTWQERVIDAAHKHALDATALTTQLKATSDKPQSVFVHLTSKVNALMSAMNANKSWSLRSTASRWKCRRAGYPGQCHSRCHRFKFEDFTNQVQFAQLSRAYNREAIKQLPKVDDSWTGKQAMC